MFKSCLLIAAFSAGAATLCPALEIAQTTEATQQPELNTYTQPLEAMLSIVEKINVQLASVQDEDSAELTEVA